jgi:hypothetical protein
MNACHKCRDFSKIPLLTPNFFLIPCPLLILTGPYFSHLIGLLYDLSNSDIVIEIAQMNLSHLVLVTLLIVAGSRVILYAGEGCLVARVEG